MHTTITPGWCSGTITAPPSKSHTQRAYAAALLSAGRTTIINAGHSADEDAARHIITMMGATIEEHESQTIISSTGLRTPVGPIHCGESGLAARLFIPIAATARLPVTLIGHGTLLQRPMAGVAELLQAAGVQVSDFNGHLPITVCGPLQADNISIDASAGSQLLSGLLFALAFTISSPVTISVSNLTSRPYIDLSLQVLQHFGCVVTHLDYEEFTIQPRKAAQVSPITIEGDWSSAAAILVAGAIGGSACVAGLDPRSVQADRLIMSVLQDAKAYMSITFDDITVRQNTLRAFSADFTHAPDLFPVAAILAACCQGRSAISGLHRLAHKESNRATTITDMLASFAVPHMVQDDMLVIDGVPELKGNITVNGHNDHRIVMAAAIGALRASGPVTVTGSEAVNKSYPSFFNHLSLLGINSTTH